MATAYHWTCFECGQTTDANEVFCECTLCQVRFCPACRMKHLRSHSHYFVMLQKVPLNGRVNSVQQCTGCQETMGLGYSCQLCSYALCLDCWRVVGINRHEHKVFNLFELQQDYGTASIVHKTVEAESRRPILPPRSQSAPTNTGSLPTKSINPASQQVQTQAADLTSSVKQPQSPKYNRFSLSRGLKKAADLSQFTKAATDKALEIDFRGIVRGLEAIGFDFDNNDSGRDDSDAHASYDNSVHTSHDHDTHTSHDYSAHTSYDSGTYTSNDSGGGD